MRVQSSLNEEDNVLTIAIQGRFDFQCHTNFRDAYEKTENKVDHYIVDLSKATSIDSSALGMLLLLRDYAGSEDDTVEIVHSDNSILRILEISNFDSLFKLREIA